MIAGSGSPVGLELRGAVAGYGRTKVINGVDLAISPGEVVGLLGANGAGKTTLLRTIAGSLPLWEGSLTIDDVDVTKLRAWSRVRKGCAHVPEGRHVFGGLTVEENLLAPQQPRKQAKVNLDWPYQLFPRLQERRAQLAGSLSGGEQQMLAIGRALMTRPRYLLIDEMSAGLAPVIVQGLTKSLRTIASEGVAIILVEQAPDYVLPIVDRVFLIARGAIAEEGVASSIEDVSNIVRSYLGVS